MNPIAPVGVPSTGTACDWFFVFFVALFVALFFSISFVWFYSPSGGHGLSRGGSNGDRAAGINRDERVVVYQMRINTDDKKNTR